MKDTARRPYAVDENYPRSLDKHYSKGTWNKVLEDTPSLSEFSRSRPSSREISYNKELLVQSEFKKPYDDADYVEMEMIGSGEPVPAPVVQPVFTASVVGKACPGEFVLFEFTFSHPCSVVKVVLPDNDPNLELEKVDVSWSAAFLYFPDTPQYRKMPFQFEATMRDPVTGISGTARTAVGRTSDPTTDFGCGSLYVEFEMVVQAPDRVVKYFVFDMRRGVISDAIPSDQWGHVVTFPCDSSDLDYFRSRMTASPVKQLLSDDPAGGVNSNTWPRYLYPVQPAPVGVSLGYSEFFVNPNPSYEKGSTGQEWYGSFERWDFISVSAPVCEKIVNGSTRLIITEQLPVNFNANRSFIFGVDAVVTDGFDLVSMMDGDQWWWRFNQYYCLSSEPCPTEKKRCRLCGLSYLEYVNQQWFGVQIGRNSWITGGPNVAIANLDVQLYSKITSDNIDGVAIVEKPLSEGFVFVGKSICFSGDRTVNPSEGVLGCGFLPSSPAWTSPYAIYKPELISSKEQRVFISMSYRESGLLYDDSGIKIDVDVNDLNRNLAVEDFVEGFLSNYPYHAYYDSFEINTTIYRGTLS